ncbi:hypothetical protein D3C72_1414130 [compost metagenome]
MLNSGAMKVGKITSRNRLNAIHTSHVHSHHSEPARSISHSTASSSGRPSTQATSVILARSSSHRPKVILLKPKRCSMPNWPYSENGRSTRPPISATLAISATPYR